MFTLIGAIFPSYSFPFLFRYFSHCVAFRSCVRHLIWDKNWKRGLGRFHTTIEISDDRQLIEEEKKTTTMSYTSLVVCKSRLVLHYTADDLSASHRSDQMFRFEAYTDSAMSVTRIPDLQ